MLRRRWAIPRILGNLGRAVFCRASTAYKSQLTRLVTWHHSYVTRQPPTLINNDVSSMFWHVFEVRNAIALVHAVPDSVLQTECKQGNTELPPRASLLEKPARLTGVDFPGFRPQRARPRYAMDSKSKSSEMSPSDCLKNSFSLTSHTGGVFSFFCKCGVCIG